MIEVLLILENEHDIEHHQFSSSEGLEKHLNTIKQKEYCRKNILFFIDSELDYEMSKIYKNRYFADRQMRRKKR
jgi:hypothetical protein